MKKWVGVLLTASLASCGGESSTMPDNLLVRNDFESTAGWLGDTPNPSLTKEKAHSGKYSVLVRPGIDYSLSYRNTLGQMMNSRPSKMKLTAWVFVPNSQVNSNLVVEIKSPDEPTAPALLWDGTPLNKVVKKFNEWQQVEKDIIIPPTTKDNSVLKLYLWRTDANVPVYMDDVELTAE